MWEKADYKKDTFHEVIIQYYVFKYCPNIILYSLKITLYVPDTYQNSFEF